MLRGVHTPNDGRGTRRVLLDGVEQDRVVFADTERGIVRMCHAPFKVCPRRLVARTYKRRGKVEVLPW